MRLFHGMRRGLSLLSVPIFWTGAGLVLFAALLGRSAPGPARELESWPSVRVPAHPRYVGFDGNLIEPRTSVPVLLDTETGAILSCPAVAGRGLNRLSCAPWRDGDGRYYLAAQCTDRSRDTFGLARLTFPGCQGLVRLGVDTQPKGRVCWSPDRSDRVLFASGEGRLYLFDLAGNRQDQEPDLGPERPRELRWRIDPPGTGVCHQTDPCWPSTPALNGWLLVTLIYREGPLGQPSTTRIWWLELSRDETAIVRAEPAIVPDETADLPRGEIERLPGVGVLRDGTPMLAYLARAQETAEWELWVVPIAPASGGQPPRVVTASARRLATGCSTALLPSFSADGRWIYAARRFGVGIRIERFAAGGAGGRATSATRR